MKIRKLRSIRLVLIVIAVILSLAILGVRILWMPTEAVPEEPVRETNGANAVQPTETVPAPTQAPEMTTEAPTEAPTELIPETEPEIPQTEQPADSETEPEAGSDEDTKPPLPFPNPNGSGDGQKEGSLENSLDNGQSGAEDPATADPPQQNSGIHTVSEERSAHEQSTVETETTMETQGQTDSDDRQIQAPGQKKNAAAVVFYILCGLLVIDLGAIVVVTIMIRKEKDNQDDGMDEKTVRMTAPQPSAQMQAPGQIRVGQLHNIGARPYQEDSSGVSELDDGILAIVADGMGGLSGGDRVSQKIVYTMLGYGDQLRPGYLDGALERMVYATNEAVNAMLGPEGLYKSGSTLLAVLVRQNRFHWITVGDSHIYYYHNGRLVQLNEEHNRGQELLHMAARGEITYEEARNAPKKNGLTSFIGMGRLKYIDKSLESIPLVSGDRILLMTDGVFNALSDQTMEAVLQKFPDVQEAAAEMERLVIQKASPRQDNFTAVILGF